MVKISGKKKKKKKNPTAQETSIGLDTVRLMVMAIRLTVEYSTAKPLTIHQATFWECLQLQDSCIVAEDSRKQCTIFFMYYYLWLFYVGFAQNTHTLLFTSIRI